jgi:uncharacterized membrane protein YgcG
MKKLSLFLATLLLLVILTPIIVKAADNDFGNTWVYDEANVVSEDTEEYIRDLNESLFASYKNKPQLVIMIINDLPCNMTQYKLDTFNDYGVGTANENCGMLFIFAINDREYGLEIGDGFVEGSMLRADLETDVVTEEMKGYLRAADYNTAVKMIVQHLEKLMADQENGVYAQKEADKIAADKAAADAVAKKIYAIGTVTLESEAAINDARSAYRSLTKHQKELVDTSILDAAETKLSELKDARFKENLKNFMIMLGIACPIVGLIILCVVLIKKKLRTNKIDELCNRHYRYITMADLDEETAKETIDKDYGKYNARNLEDEFMNILYQMYIDKQVMVIQATAKNMKCSPDMYLSELYRVNDRPAFERCRLTNLAIIVANVDERQRKKEELRELNTHLVNDFLSANRHRVSDSEIWINVCNAMHKMFDNFATEVGAAKLESYFSEQLDSVGFEKEFDKFLNANQDKIGRDFNRNTLYNEMCATSNYRSYHYGNRMDRVWMMHMLMSHQNRQKQNRLDQERRDREAAERRRREAQRRAQQQSVSSRNSSFGGGFGGGRSSGGGMRGGW